MIVTIPCSSMVEQEAVNFEVVSSSLTGGAIFISADFTGRFLLPAAYYDLARLESKT